MIDQLNPYLFFPGTCEKALNFYKEAFNGEITSLQHFGDANMPVEDDYKNKIMHAELKIGDISILFSDGAPHKDITEGDNVHISLNFSDEKEMRMIWDKLEKDGSVHMELQDTFWGAVFGQLQDQFGIRWMFNCEKKD